MVKSKKMSKTSIAVIVLALLLVLSMIMGLTGAWFTKSHSAETAGAGSITFGNIATASVSLSETAGVYAVDEDHVLPGDTLPAVGVTVSLNHNVDVYATLKHVKLDSSVEYYKMSAGAISLVGSSIDSSNLAQFEIEAMADNANAASYSFSVAALPIPQTTQSGDTVGGYQVVMGGTIEITSANGTYYLYVIQADNISNADAITYLTTGVQAESVHAD